MPTVRLSGHDLAYPLVDVLRLFYGPPVRQGSGELAAGPALPFIRSEWAADGTPANVVIRTYLEDRLSCETAVPMVLARREMKRQLYQVLAALSGDTYPWGSLTGIRPTLVAGECLQRLGSKREAQRELVEHWFVTPEKADLALDTALAETAILGRISPDNVLVYVGIPFCPSRCAYCSFITQDALRRADLLEPYVEAMSRETALIFGNWPSGREAAAIYVGGGTPTSLADPLFERLLKDVVGAISAVSAPLRELTVEAGRPDTLAAKKLSLIRDAAATRLCINPQTFHDATLQRIGRQHRVQDLYDAFSLARSMGFDKINMDLIAGLPGESPADFADSLAQALQMAPESITIHTLALKRSSRLNQKSAGDVRIGRPDPELAAMLAEGRRLIQQAGLHPYYLYRQKDTAGGLENTGFAQPGCGCLYNVGMMSDRRTVIGIGSGAMTKRVTGNRVDRLANPRDIAEYIRRIEEIAARKVAFLAEQPH